MITTTAFARGQNGVKVQAGKPFVPEVLFQGEYYPICGHYFWDNDNGATTLCKMLGFKMGIIKETRATYNKDSMPIGACKAGEPLTSCTGGGNAWGNLNYRNGWCKKGTKVGVTVTCDPLGLCRALEWT